MNQLTTEVKTHWVITHKDSHHHITAEQESKLASIGLDDLINIDGNSIKGSSIAEVLTNETYKLTYPNRNYNYGQPPTPLPVVPLPNIYKTIDQKMSERKSWLEAGLRGLKKAQAFHKASGHPSPNCDAMIRDMEKRIANFRESVEA